MSITYRYRVSVALPTSQAPVADGKATATGPAKGVAFSGLAGALAGTAGGAALGVGAAGPMPGVGLGVLIAGGLLFGAINGGLLGLMGRLEGR